MTTKTKTARAAEPLHIRSAYVTDAITHADPREVDALRRIVAALDAAGFTVKRVHDGDCRKRVSGIEDILTLAYNLEGFTLQTKGGGGVYTIMDQYPDTFADWTMDVDAAIHDLVMSLY